VNYVLNTILYFSIDNAHQNIFIAAFDVQIMCIRQLTVELGSIDRGQRNSLKAIVVILSMMKNCLDLNSLMFNKY
jgi:hypothetical protein